MWCKKLNLFHTVDTMLLQLQNALKLDYVCVSTYTKITQNTMARNNIQARKAKHISVMFIVQANHSNLWTRP